MLSLTKNVLVLTQDFPLSRRISGCAESLSVACMVSETFREESVEKLSRRYRIILCDSDLTHVLPKKAKRKTVVILNAGESFMRYAEDFDCFVFDRNDKDEIARALYIRKLEYKDRNTTVRSVSEAIERSGNDTYSNNGSEFYFGDDYYLYKGEPLMLAESIKIALADWLLLGHKGENMRLWLWRMRKKLGSEFLSEIPRRRGS